MNLPSFTMLSNADCIQWCLNQGLLTNHPECPSCRGQGHHFPMSLQKKIRSYIDEYCWRCTQHECKTTRSIKNYCHRVLKIWPKKSIKLSLCYIFDHFLNLLPQSISMKILKISRDQIRKMNRELNDIIVHAFNQEELVLDLMDTVVEIDESCFFRRKYNQGRLRRIIWVLGIFERHTGRLYCEVVPRRDAQTLIPRIVNKVVPETLISTDAWRAYAGLRNNYFEHEVVIHAQNFVNPQNEEIHTQNIENRWGYLKSMMRKGRFGRILFRRKLKEMVWRSNHQGNLDSELLEILLSE